MAYSLLTSMSTHRYYSIVSMVYPTFKNLINRDYCRLCLLVHRYLTSRNGIGNGRRARYVPRCSGSAEAGYKSVTRYTSMIQDKQYFYRIYKCVYRLEVSALWALFLILFLYKNTQRREENHQIIEVMMYAES